MNLIQVCQLALVIFVDFDHDAQDNLLELSVLRVGRYEMTRICAMVLEWRKYGFDGTSHGAILRDWRA